MNDPTKMVGANPKKYFKDLRLKGLYEYWQSRCHGDRFPKRADLELDRLGSLNNGLWLCDYEPDADTFRYRIAGPDLAHAVGKDITGLLLSDFTNGDQFGLVNASLKRAVQEPSIFYMSGAVHQPVGRPSVGERLGLPLQEEDSEHPDGLLGVTVADWIPIRKGKTTEDITSRMFFPILPNLAA